MPRAHVQTGLLDVRVHVGEDAAFRVQLSIAVSGTWFLNGEKLEKEEEGQQYQVTHSGVDHSLQIRRVQLGANESKVQFEANGVKECAVLHVQGKSY